MRLISNNDTDSFLEKFQIIALKREIRNLLAINEKPSRIQENVISEHESDGRKTVSKV